MGYSVRPWALRVEASSVCQLRCPTCPTTTGATRKVIGRGFLRADQFRGLIHNAPFPLKLIELANYGEAFLNPEFLEILQIAHEHGVKVGCFSGANLNNVKEDVLEGVVKYGMLGLNCSIDGASQATYEIYRRRGHFETVIENIKKINYYKKLYETPTPRLTWQFVAFGHNEHEIEIARALAGDLGMSFHLKLSWDNDFSPVKDEAQVANGSGLGAATVRDFVEINQAPYFGSICEQMWNFPQINFDGKVLGCCANFWDDYGGDAFEDLSAALNGERIRYARAMLMGKEEARADIPCSTCHVYKTRLSTQSWIDESQSDTLAF